MQYAALRYGIEERSQGRKVVVRIGPFGGKRVVNVYKEKSAAQRVVDLLTELKNQEI